MGSIIRFERPRPVIRQLRAKVAPEKDSPETRRSLLILVGSFFITAVVMCVAVVAMVSNTWTDVLIMSAFVLVFALLKILLANALIYAMLRDDRARAQLPAQAPALAPYMGFSPLRQPPSARTRRSASPKDKRPRTPTGTLQPAPRR